MKKNVRIFSFFYLVLIGSNLYSQEKKEYKRLIVKLVPLASIDIDNTWQLAVEHRLRNTWTMVEEFGYGRFADNPWQINNENNSQRETYRAKLEFRNYKVKSPFLTGNYIGYELFYKQVNDVINRTISRECDSGNCNYFEKLDYDVSKYVFGGNVKFGFQGRFGSKTSHSNFTYDVFGGFGIRRRQVNHKNAADLNQGFSNNNSFLNNDSIFSAFGSKDNAITLPNLTVGIKIGLIVK
jgi:hypothetical protein